MDNVEDAFAHVRDQLMAVTKGMPNKDFLAVLDLLQLEIDTHRGSLEDKD